MSRGQDSDEEVSVCSQPECNGDSGPLMMIAAGSARWGLIRLVFRKIGDSEGSEGAGVLMGFKFDGRNGTDVDGEFS